MKVRSTGQPVGEVGGEAEHTTEPNTSTLLPNLIARLEQAGEGSRELDAEILLVFHPELAEWPRTDHGGWMSPEWGLIAPAPAYTTSVDATLALIGQRLPGWCASVVILSPEPCEGYVWERGHRDGGQGKGETGAIALCLALCRALQAQGQTHDA